MTEEELKQLKISLAADQAMNALLASIGEPPDTSFIDDLKKRGIPIPDMTDYVPETVSDAEFFQKNNEFLQQSMSETNSPSVCEESDFPPTESMEDRLKRHGTLHWFKDAGHSE